ANRLGVFQLKWELEDLSFRFLEPELYRRIAGMLDEKRLEREHYIRRAVGALGRELEATGVRGEIHGRPKHIYSIWNKMRTKSLDFSQLYDVRALRVIVPSVKDCYTALGVVHNRWQPIPKEFDDYISRPKGNLYQSLHTAVVGPEGKTVEVQIRTVEMHRHAEFGVASHWRYKEKVKTSEAFEQKIAWLRELLAWRDEVADWASTTKKAQLDDTVYVLTPQGKVIDLPAGSTPIDLAYALPSRPGHRCRGARVDGQIVPLDTPLASGQRVEIVTAKSGGPSRDWLNAECCKPLPPDPIRGFVTRGKGVSVHREDCASLKRLAERQPERLIDARWGEGPGSYTVEMAVTATDRRGLLRDIGDALAREKIN